jgi:uncharacterized protein YndB with AHSA1/START domain
MKTSNEVRVERHIAASADRVYAYLTESDLWAKWQGESAVIDPRPGGGYRMSMGNGMRASGQFVELVPHRRVVFTWGWEGHPALPPGSSRVEIDLIPDGLGTLVRLTHRDLPPDEITKHRAGWDHYLPRLAAAAEGHDPGPDPGP